MARKGKIVNKVIYQPVYKEKFELLLKKGKAEKQEQKPPDNTFLGFKLTNHNKLWRWDTMEDL